MSTATDAVAAVQKTDRIKSLDGWRGIAILMVLASHSALALRHIGWLAELGQHGVTLFFVISGFIITRRLLDEQSATGGISLSGFYIRRAFRILPCAWMYISVMCVVSLMAVGRLPKQLFAVLFFFRNYVDKLGHDTVITGHFWSLSIEEQFYTIWPLLLISLGVKRARWIAVVAAIGIAFWRWHNRFLLFPLPLQSTFGTQFRADALFLGCAAALVPDTIRRALRLWICVPAAVLLFSCTIQNRFLIPFYESLAMAVLILITANYDSHPVVRSLLGSRPLVRAGVISYSLYIWQQFFIFMLAPLAGVVISLAGVFLAAHLSYEHIERPLIRKGRIVAARSKETISPVGA